MSYAKLIEQARHEAFLITVNNQLSIHALNEMYQTHGYAYLCEDGKITYLIMNEVKENV